MCSTSSRLPRRYTPRDPASHTPSGPSPRVIRLSPIPARHSRESGNPEACCSSDRQVTHLSPEVKTPELPIIERPWPKPPVRWQFPRFGGSDALTTLSPANPRINDRRWRSTVTGSTDALRNPSPCRKPVCGGAPPPAQICGPVYQPSPPPACGTSTPVPD